MSKSRSLSWSQKEALCVLRCGAYYPVRRWTAAESLVRKGLAIRVQQRLYALTGTGHLAALELPVVMLIQFSSPGEFGLWRWNGAYRDEAALLSGWEKQRATNWEFWEKNRSLPIGLLKCSVLAASKIIRSEAEPIPAEVMPLPH